MRSSALVYRADDRSLLLLAYRRFLIEPLGIWFGFFRLTQPCGLPDCADGQRTRTFEVPGKSGFDLCREIRAGKDRVPILMLSAKGQEIDKVVGLELGADDYVTKPFSLRELLARVQALLRRAQTSRTTQ